MPGTIPELIDASGFQLGDVFEIYQASSLDNRRATGSHVKERFEATGFSFTGQVAGASGGTALAPSFAFVGETDTGIYLYGANAIGFAAAGGPVGYINNAGLTVETSSASQLNVFSDSLATLKAATFVASSTGPVFRLTKGRGTNSGKAAVANADSSGSIFFAAMGDASTEVNHISITGTVTQATPSPTAMGARLAIGMCEVGSSTRTEFLRGEHATGLSIRSRVVVDQDGGIQKYSRTVAQINALTPTAGREFFCSNESGGAVPVFGDGTNWRRMTDRAIMT